MKAYWLRLLGALVLLKLASGLMRDAEKILASNISARSAEVKFEYQSNEATDREVEDALSVQHG